MKRALPAMFSKVDTLARLVVRFLPTPRYSLDPADIARLTPLGHPTINLQGRYRTTSRAPLTGLRPLRTKRLRILHQSSSQAYLVSADE